MFCHFLIDRGSHVGDVDWKGKLRSKHALTLGRKNNQKYTVAQKSIKEKKDEVILTRLNIWKVGCEFHSSPGEFYHT